MWFSLHLDSYYNCRHFYSLDLELDIKIKEIVIYRDIYGERDEENKHEIKYGKSPDDIKYVRVGQF